jgi:hypothetical protein
MRCDNYSVCVSLLLSAVLGVVGAGAHGADEAAPADAFARDVQPIFKAYCVHCHGGEEPEGGLRLDVFDQVPSVADDQEKWAAIVEMVSSDTMPPEDEPQPGAEETTRFLAWINGQLARFDCQQKTTPQSSPITIRRLNRSEYDNTIRDLLGVDYQPGEDFPADDIGLGFDNIADVLSLPPLLMEKYLEAAEEVVAKVVGEPEAKQRLIICQPDDSKSRHDCTREFVQIFGKRALRRPLQAAEVDRLCELAGLAERHGASYEQGIELIVQALLISPNFLFRIEIDGDEDDISQTRLLTDYELATRLSYFLWSTMPDDELMALADAGRLRDEAVLAEQIERMLQDAKANALVENFAGQWLQLRQLTKATPDPGQYADFDESLREAMLGETKTFFDTIMRQDRSILELIDSEYTFVNARLARHYGIDGIVGDEFQRVPLTDRRRGGLLTQASILTLTSNPTRTSPVKRGKWILENILGTPPPPPPPDVPDLAEEDDMELLGSLRERMEQHRSNPSCAVCHKKMDALGFGFENFDGIGRWRDRDGRYEIDPSGELPGGVTFSGPGELKAILRDMKRQFTRCLAEKLLIYALGRGLESQDRCVVDDIVSSVENSGYRFSSLVAAIVASDPFRHRGARGEN